MAFGKISCPAPECDGKVSQVLSTNGKKRFRRCMKCGTKFSTYEIKAHSYNLLRALIVVADKRRKPKAKRRSAKGVKK